MGAYLYWTTKQGDSKILYFDVVTEVQHALGSEIVESPVEEGVDVTDHIRPKVPMVTLSAFVSNHPIITKDEAANAIALLGPNPTGKIYGAQKGSVKALNIPTIKYDPPFVPTPGGALNALTTAIGSLLTTPKDYAANTLQFDGQFDNVKEVYKVLEFARGESQLVNCVTEVRNYSSMGIEDVQLIRNPGTGTGAEIKVQLRQVRLVSTRSVNIPKPADPNATAAVDKGSKNTKDAKISVAAKGVKALANFGGVSDVFSGTGF